MIEYFAHKIIYDMIEAREIFRERLNKKRELLKRLPRKAKKEMKKDIALDEVILNWNPLELF